MDLELLHAAISQAVRDHGEGLLIGGIEEEDGLDEEVIQLIADQVIEQFTPPPQEWSWDDRIELGPASTQLINQD